MTETLCRTLDILGHIVSQRSRPFGELKLEPSCVSCFTLCCCVRRWKPHQLVFFRTWHEIIATCLMVISDPTCRVVIITRPQGWVLYCWHQYCFIYLYVYLMGSILCSSPVGSAPLFIRCDPIGCWRTATHCQMSLDLPWKMSKHASVLL